MAVLVDIDEAAEWLEDIIARAEAGEEVHLTRHGKPVVSIEPVEAPATTDAPTAA